MLDGGQTPILSNRELYEMGFAMVVHGTTLIMRVAKTMRDTLADMKADRLRFGDTSVSFEEFKQINDFSKWSGIEDRFGR
jgi:2-methylisocitrate lyase-like PEP mutase family enzyme